MFSAGDQPPTPRRKQPIFVRFRKAYDLRLWKKKEKKRKAYDLCLWKKIEQKRKAYDLEYATPLVLAVFYCFS